MKSPQQSTEKLFVKTFIRIKKSSSTNHMIRIIGGVKTKNQTVKGRVLHGFCAEKSNSMASIAG